MQLTGRREYGTTPAGNPMGGRWVVRDAQGVYVDHDQYRNDLEPRHAKLGHRIQFIEETRTT
jgi:hypothetical protein